MQNKTDPPNYRTSLPLIFLTLVVGLALGWLLRDVLRRTEPSPAAPATARPEPTAVAAQPTAVAVQPPATAPAIPTATLIPAPTYTPTPVPTVAPAQPTLAATSPAAPTAAAEEIAAYAGHVVAEGETLEQIAANGGSTPELIARYNLLAEAPRPGRALIIPRLAGQSAVLESEPILVVRGRDDVPWVALTLDAGASAEPVPAMLETLRDRGVKITFFLTGKWIEENPDLTRAIVADGHEIANHTVSHPDLTTLDDAAIQRELAETEALLRQTTGTTTRPFFRPPFGAYDDRVLQIVEAEGYLPIYWTLDSLDSVGEPKTPEFLVERVTGKLTPEQLRGAIILAHCGSWATAEALPEILDRFAEMGFEVKKVSEVLAGRG